jgi:hypothetical protein
MLEQAGALDEDVVVAVDQNVGDRAVLEQGLERPKAQKLVQDVVDQLRALGQDSPRAAVREPSRRSRGGTPRVPSGR